MDLLVSLPSGVHRLEIEAGLSSSLLGIPGVSPCLQPDWKLRYLLDRGRRLPLSNANRYPEEALAPQLEEYSEDARWLQAEGGLGWLLQERLYLVASGEAS